MCTSCTCTTYYVASSPGFPNLFNVAKVGVAWGRGYYICAYPWTYLYIDSGGLVPLYVNTMCQDMYDSVAMLCVCTVGGKELPSAVDQGGGED